MRAPVQGPVQGTTARSEERRCQAEARVSALGEGAPTLPYRDGGRHRRLLGHRGGAAEGIGAAAFQRRHPTTRVKRSYANDVGRCERGTVASDGHGRGTIEPTPRRGDVLHGSAQGRSVGRGACKGVTTDEGHGKWFDVQTDLVGMPNEFRGSRGLQPVGFGTTAPGRRVRRWGRWPRGLRACVRRGRSDRSCRASCAGRRGRAPRAPRGLGRCVK